VRSEAVVKLTAGIEPAEPPEEVESAVALAVADFNSSAGVSSSRQVMTQRAGEREGLLEDGFRPIVTAKTLKDGKTGSTRPLADNSSAVARWAVSGDGGGVRRPVG
jgi:hypothetical protein